MINSKKLVLTGKRWRKFHEFTAVPIFIGAASIIGCLLRIKKVGFTEWQLIPFATVPILFIAWWIPYKNKELRFSEIQTPYNKEDNYRVVVAALTKLNWTVKEDTDTFIEAYTLANIGLTWGSDMITILIEDKRIFVNSLSNLDIVKNQAFFTFGKLRRNTKKLINEIAEELNTAHNMNCVKNQINFYGLAEQ